MGNDYISRRDAARNVDLVAFLTARGIRLKASTDGWYQVKDGEHDSLYVKNKSFQWFSHGKSQRKDGSDNNNNAITFCMDYFGWDYNTAVDELLDAPRAVELPVPESILETSSERTYEQNCRRVFAYLAKKRCIDYDLVRELVERGRIRQDTYGNCCFIVNDFSENYVCEFLRGTGDAAFKGQRGLQNDFGFAYGNTVNPSFLVFFEAPIDLLSFVMLGKYHRNGIGTMRPASKQAKDMVLAHRDDIFDNSLYVALGGSVNKDSVCRNYFEKYNRPIIIAVDNDDAGNTFWDAVQRRNGVVARLIPTDGCKDWNDVLKRIKGK